MYWDHKGHELDGFIEKWGEIRQVAVFGLGQWARRYMDEISRDIQVCCVIDNDPGKQGQSYRGIPVVSLEEYLSGYRRYRILISVYYQEISRQLLENELVEEEDFCDMSKFVSVWYWHNRHELHLTRVNTAITTKCTLNCKNCNMFIPYHREGASIPVEEIEKDYESFFKIVDRVYAMSLLGGEPLLHPQFPELITHLSERYGDRITELGIITNATCIPGDDVFGLMKDHHIFVQVSDYTDVVDYRERLGRFIAKLESFGISYRIVKYDFWLDFGFPQNPWDVPQERLVAHMQDCSPLFRGLNDGRFYYCHVCWSAGRSGHLPIDPADFLELASLQNRDEDKKRLLEFNLGYMDKGALSLCRYCGGCGDWNMDKIPAGVQMKR